MENGINEFMNDAQGTLRKIFITVKTYPTLSSKYDELVCTAGILDDGTWARIYPLPFRKLDSNDWYKKYQWMEVPLEKNTSNTRPESYRVSDFSRLKLLGKPVDTKDNWRKRKEILFKKNKVCKDTTLLIKKQL